MRFFISPSCIGDKLVEKRRDQRWADRLHEQLKTTHTIHTYSHHISPMPAISHSTANSSGRPSAADRGLLCQIAEVHRQRHLVEAEAALDAESAVQAERQLDHRHDHRQEARRTRRRADARREKATPPDCRWPARPRRRSAPAAPPRRRRSRPCSSGSSRRCSPRLSGALRG